MKPVKLLSVQVFVLVCLFGFIFFQWFILSTVEKEKQAIESDLIEYKSYEKKYNVAKEEMKQLAEENEQLKNELTQYQAERGKKKIAYLTFDDGPSKTTESVLRTLKKYDVQATFFVNGNDSEFAQSMYKEIVQNGHTLGNHTYSHDYAYIYKNKENFFKDVHKLNDFLSQFTGNKPVLLRFPGGSNNHISHQYGGKKLMQQLVKETENQQMIYVDWNVDSQDASAVRVNEKVIIEAVLKGSQGKQYINVLMHDAGAKETTAKALPKIIEGLKKQGFEFRAMTPFSPYFQF